MTTAYAARASGISTSPSLEHLYEEVERLHLTPGWIPRKKPILWSEPNPTFAPAHWSYTQARASLDEAGRLIDVSLAERRNLIMQNPAPASNFETTRTLVCAYQMILPGEVAPSHRHSSHALRVILHGEGSYSVVNGQKMPMETGDIVLTPGGCWHGHLAVDRLESGQRTRRCRSTANTVFLAIEGSGESRIGDAKFAWQKCDAFVAPSWTKFEHAANSDSMLFILSDEPLLRFSNYYRFEAD